MSADWDTLEDRLSTAATASEGFRFVAKVVRYLGGEVTDLKTRFADVLGKERLNRREDAIRRARAHVSELYPSSPSTSRYGNADPQKRLDQELQVAQFLLSGGE